MTGAPSMSDFDGQPAGNPTRPGGPPLPDSGGEYAFAAPGFSAGTLLRQAREAAGLHVAALAVSLKVPVKKLEALEADRLDLLPDAVFARALAASVCRTLKIDAVQVLALLPKTDKPRLAHKHTQINTPFRSPSDGPGPSFWPHISRPAVLACLLLLLGAVVLIFLPAVQKQDTVAQSVMEPSAAAALPANSQVTQSSQSGVAMTNIELRDSTKAAPSSSSLIESAAIAVTAPSAQVLAPNLSSKPGLSMPAASTGPASLNLSAADSMTPLPPALVQPAPTGIIVFKAKGESWVEVTDAKGIVVLRRTLTPGEAVGASGVLPLAAVVGRADATQVQVRGQAFDLSAVSKDNVARFEVK